MTAATDFDRLSIDTATRVAQHRTRRAAALGAVLYLHGATADEAASLPPEGWAVVDRLAGVTSTSVHTRAMAVAMLREAVR